MCLFVYVPVRQYGHICMQLFMEAQESADFLELKLWQV